MNILVMGGTTFVSKCFAMHAIEKGYTVDIFTRGKTEVDYGGVNEHLKGDRRNKEDLKKRITKAYDYVVDINAYTEDDVRMLCEVLDKSNLKRYVFCSTCSVYMWSDLGVKRDENSPRGYDDKFGGDYGFHKMKAEDYLLNSDIPVTIFRPTYIYGEENNIYRDAFLFESIEKGKVSVIEDKHPAQFVYIWDLVKSFESCFDNEASINQAYNLTNEDGIMWSEWVEAGLKATEKDAKVKVYTEEMIRETGHRVFPFGDVEILFGIEKLKKHGLFVPETPIEKGLENAYDWFKKVDACVANRGRFEIE